MVDLAMHLMDIVQNSIRAQASEIGICFFEESCDHTLTFRVKDNGCGMDKETVEKLADPFFTTRTTRRVGLGIPFLKMTCEQSGGSLLVQSETGAGTIVEAVYRTDHPDCLPLGDIAGYMALLLQANPDIHLRFSYRIDQSLFAIDAHELKEEGIDLKYPEMVPAVKEFIGLNLKEIYSKRPPVSFLCR